MRQSGDFIDDHAATGAVSNHGADPDRMIAALLTPPSGVEAAAVPMPLRNHAADGVVSDR